MAGHCTSTARLPWILVCAVGASLLLLLALSTEELLVPQEHPKHIVSVSALHARRRDEGDAMAANIAKLEPDVGKAARLMGPGLWYEAEHVAEGERGTVLPDKLKAIREDLLTCARELNASKLPQFDELTQADCSKAAFTPFRRESSAMRTLWCLMQRQDVSSFLDTFTSFGGVSLIAAHGAQVVSTGLAVHVLLTIDGAPTCAACTP